MNEIVDAITSRFKAPYFGYALLAFFALNWRGIFLLVVSDAAPLERLAAFDSETDIYSLVILPLLTGAAVAATAHWVRYVFGMISSKPLELIDNLDLEAQHKRAIRQAELEQSRTKLFAIKEKELIDRAKRDEEVEGITDESEKKKLKDELARLRRERDELYEEAFKSKNENIKLSKEARNLLLAAASDKNGRILKPRAFNQRSMQAGGSVFGNENQRDYAKYEAALDELISYDLVRDRGYEGEMYELTHAGWELSNSLYRKG
jgi:hypothetical protein